MNLVNTKNVLALVRNRSHRMTSHQAVLRLVVKLRSKGRFFVDLRRIGGWHVSDLERRLQVW